MTAQAVSKELARLSYTDMMLFAAKLIAAMKSEADGFPVEITREQLANALAKLLASFDGAPDAMEAASNKHLKNAFSSRNKSIHVRVLPTGWEVSFGQHTAVGQRLPDAINNLLDTLITMKAMGV